MPDPFFSVAMPVKDPNPEFFRQAYYSVHDQLKPRGNVSGEILLQDNGDLWSVVDHLPGIITDYRKNDADYGCYGSINAALQRARGEWVHILHDDDFLLPGFYETMRRVCESLPPDYGAASCRCGRLIDDVVRYADWTYHAGRGNITPFLKQTMRKCNLFDVPAVVIRRSVFQDIGLFREDLPYAGDWEFYLRLLTKYDWWYEPSDLARYRVHPGQRAHAMQTDGRAARDVELVRGLAHWYLEKQGAVTA